MLVKATECCSLTVLNIVKTMSRCLSQNQGGGVVAEQKSRAHRSATQCVLTSLKAFSKVLKGPMPATSVIHEIHGSLNLNLPNSSHPACGERQKWDTHQQVWVGVVAITTAFRFLAGTHVTRAIIVADSNHELRSCKNRYIWLWWVLGIDASYLQCLVWIYCPDYTADRSVRQQTDNMLVSIISAIETHTRRTTETF